MLEVLRKLGIDPVRPDRRRRPESRPHAARARRRVRARVVRRALRAPRDLRDDQQGAVVHPDERGSLVPSRLGTQRPVVPRGGSRRERRGGRARARADPGGRAAVVSRLRAGERPDEELVRDAGERRARRARGIHRHGRARSRPARGQACATTTCSSGCFRPSCSRRRCRRASSFCTSCCPGIARTGCSARAAPAARSPASPRRGRPGGAGAQRAAQGAARARRARARRGRGCARQAPRPRRGARAAGGAAGADADGRVHRAVRLAAVGRGPPREPVRLRLRVGGLLPGGQAPLGLLRAPDPLRRPFRRPHRAAHRPGTGLRGGARPLVGGRLRAAPRRRVRRCDARRAPRVPALRGCGSRSSGRRISRRRSGSSSSARDGYAQSMQA